MAYPLWVGADAAAMLRGLLEKDVVRRFGLGEAKAHKWKRRRLGAGQPTRFTTGRKGRSCA